MSPIKNICFSEFNFDRNALKRTDDSWIQQQLDHPQSQFLICWNNQFLVDDESNIQLFEQHDVSHFSSVTLQWKYLGEFATHRSLFCAEITEPTKECEHQNWQSIRSIGLQQSAEDAAVIIYAQGLLNWHRENNFCNRCGSEFFEKQSGHALICSLDSCQKEIFPRTDPAVIILIHHQEECLLGRHQNWPENVYSCLAGFVETGEDLKAAVRREIYEESGLTINTIEYRGSQPWPFPQSLMLGFIAESQSKELTFHDGEIDDARWYSREQLIDAVNNKSLRLPSSLSISYDLVEDWFNRDSEKTLVERLSE